MLFSVWVYVCVLHPPQIEDDVTIPFPSAEWARRYNVCETAELFVGVGWKRNDEDEWKLPPQCRQKTIFICLNAMNLLPFNKLEHFICVNALDGITLQFQFHLRKKTKYENVMPNARLVYFPLCCHDTPFNFQVARIIPREPKCLCDTWYVCFPSPKTASRLT